MLTYHYENLHKYPLFDTPYKIHMKGFIDLNGNDFIYILYSHGDVYGFRPDVRTEKLNIYKNEEIQELVKKSKRLDCFKYEQTLIVEKEKNMFSSNLFKLEEVGMPPFEEIFFIPNFEMEQMVMDGNKYDKITFLSEIYLLMPDKSLDTIIADLTSILEDRKKESIKVHQTKFKPVPIEELKENIKGDDR